MNNCNYICHSTSVQMCDQNNLNFCYNQQGDTDLYSENEKLRVDIFKNNKIKKNISLYNINSKKI